MDFLEMKCKSLNVELDRKCLQLFFGCFDFDVTKFQFHSGEKQQIQQIKLFVQTNRSTKDNSYFGIENECDVSTVNTIGLAVGLFFRNTTKAIKVNEQTEHTKLTTTENSENSESTNVEQTDYDEPIITVNSGLGKDEIVKENLFNKCVSLLNGLERKPQELRLMTSDMVIVEKTENSIRGKIICIFCKSKTSKSPKKHITIQAIFSKRSAIYWNLSNYKKHLRQVHKIEVADNTSEDVPLSASADFSLISVSNDGSTPYHSVEKMNYSDCSEKDLLRDEIFNQISVQILKKNGDVLLYSEVTEQITFRINEIDMNVNVAKIKGDGSCMFAALCHQLHDLEIGSENHDSFTENLRLEVINYLRNNLSEFKIVLKGRLFEEWEESGTDELERSKDFTDEDWMDHFHNLLSFQMPKQSFWGGGETLKAVGEIYNTNIAIINEGGDLYFVTGFNSKCNRTIVLAYRYSKFSKKRNHYDSASEIEHQVIFSCAEHLSQKLLNDQNNVQRNSTVETSFIQLD